MELTALQKKLKVSPTLNPDRTTVEEDVLE